MAYELRYATYNPGQYPEHHQALQDMADDGWRVLTASLNYNEVYVLWERGGEPVPKRRSGRSKAKAAPDSGENGSESSGETDGGDESGSEDEGADSEGDGSENE